MSNKWRDRLTDLLDDDNAAHNTSTTTHARKEAPPTGPGQKQKNAQLGPPKTPKTHPESGERGLVATWASTFGFVSIHDPTTGEWHDIKTKEAPGWALAEAGLRKRLYRGGDRRAYSHNAKKMQEIWKTEHPPMEEGIVEEFAPDAADQREDFSW